MIPFISIVILLTLIYLVLMINDGYVNTINSLAYFLKQHARKTEERFAKRSKMIKDAWVKELEI